eukprot:11865508-Alexandrium_andersonii.AAC.1
MTQEDIAIGAILMHVVYSLHNEGRACRIPFPEENVSRVARYFLAGACKSNSRALQLLRHLKGGAGPRECIWPVAPPPPAIWRRRNAQQPCRHLY